MAISGSESPFPGAPPIKNDLTLPEILGNEFFCKNFPEMDARTIFYIPEKVPEMDGITIFTTAKKQRE